MSEIQVPDDYPTIQQAINAANNDDVVIIGAGTWVEDLQIHSKRVNLQGATGDPADVIIQHPSPSSANQLWMRWVYGFTVIERKGLMTFTCRAGAHLSTPAGGPRTSGGSNLDLTTIPPGPMVLLTSGTLTRDFTTRQHWEEVLELWFALGNPR
jgi:hypothetical protein